MVQLVGASAPVAQREAACSGLDVEHVVQIDDIAVAQSGQCALCVDELTVNEPDELAHLHRHGDGTAVLICLGMSDIDARVVALGLSIDEFVRSELILLHAVVYDDFLLHSLHAFAAKLVIIFHSAKFPRLKSYPHCMDWVV